MIKNTYLSPEMTIITVNAQTVLCQSSGAVSASSIEEWTYEEFEW